MKGLRVGNKKNRKARRNRASESRAYIVKIMEMGNYTFRDMAAASELKQIEENKNRQITKPYRATNALVGGLPFYD